MIDIPGKSFPPKEQIKKLVMEILLIQFRVKNANTKIIALLILHFSLILGTSYSSGNFIPGPLNRSLNRDTLNNKKDSCILDFRKGLLGSKEVNLGVTRFKEIQKMFGDKEAINRRAFFSSSEGFFALYSALLYPELGLEFAYLSIIHQKGQRSFFHNHKVNSIWIYNNCQCQLSLDGIGFGSSYNEIIIALKPDNISYISGDLGGMENITRLSVRLILSYPIEMDIDFYGEYAPEKSDFKATRAISISYFKRNY